MTDLILQVKNLNKAFGGVVATDHLDFDVRQGEIHAVIGPNGAGKTTFVAQIAGMLTPDSGEIIFDGQEISGLSAPERSHAGLARSFQITSVFPNFTAIENVALSIQAHDGHSFRFWTTAFRDAKLIQPARNILEQVGLADRALSLAGNLAHGEQRQLEIAMALATKPKLLLLDEPTAGMGAEESEIMRQFLLGLKGEYSIILIEHDMDTVFNLSDRITVLVYGRGIATGAPDEIRSNAQVKAAYLGEDEAQINA
jgi:branched-chain amino acid transport system ATP-binding protein